MRLQVCGLLGFRGWLVNTVTTKLQYRKILKELSFNFDVRKGFGKYVLGITTERTPKPFLLLSVLKISEKMRGDARLCAKPRVLSRVSQPDFQHVALWADKSGFKSQSTTASCVTLDKFHNFSQLLSDYEDNLRKLCQEAVLGRWNKMKYSLYCTCIVQCLAYREYSTGVTLSC